MKNKIIKSMISACLVAIMILTTVSSTSKANDQAAAGSPMTEAGAAEIKSKSEVVYANLSANGSIDAVYVVNHFELEKGGSITDYGNYESVLNLTENNSITMNGDSVTMQTEAENFYYQGNLKTTDLPWSFEITYNLDGTTIAPQELAGKSGLLEIHLKATGNKNVNPSFYENYMLQISITLNSDKCKNIEAPEATIAEAGSNRILAFTTLPNNEIDVQIKTEVKDFTMSGIEISAMPFSMNFDLSDTDELLEGFNQLPEAIKELNDGVGKLADGTEELKAGAEDLKNGSTEFNYGLSELEKNSHTITDASSQIKAALEQISTSLKDGSAADMDLTALTQLPLGLSQLADGLEGISSGLKELQKGYASAYAVLDSTIQGIPDSIITEDEIDAKFPILSDDQRKLLDQLYASYEAGQKVKATYIQVQQAFAMVSPTIETLTTNINTISGSLDDISLQLGSSFTDLDITEQLSQLTKGLSDLASNYAAFDEGLNEYMEGIGQISDGYGKFHSGLSKFGKGVSDLNNGVEELYDGTGQLNDEVSKMPDMIQDEIDKVMSEFDSSDFLPVSYLSSENDKIEIVQFVLKCEGIKLPEDISAVDSSEETKGKETVWDRFIALFK